MKPSFPLILPILVLFLTVGNATERGKAYIYPPESEGYATASGEAFHHADFTAGHAKLPFGTIVKVTNIWNGKSVNVRINDRRSHRSQLIRLTHAAAAQLDMLSHGVMDVDVQSIGSVAPQPTTASSAPIKNPFSGLFEQKAKAPTQAVSMPQQTKVATRGIGGSAAGAGASRYTVPYSTAQTSGNRIQAPAVPNVKAVAPAPVQAPAPVANRKGSFPNVGAQAAQPQGRFFLQFASFPDHRSAKDFANVIDKRGAPTKVISDPGGAVHRVVSDHFFQTKAEATAAAKRTATHVGYHSVVLGG